MMYSKVLRWHSTFFIILYECTFRASMFWRPNDMLYNRHHFWRRKCMKQHHRIQTARMYVNFHILDELRWNASVFSHLSLSLSFGFQSYGRCAYTMYALNRGTKIWIGFSAVVWIWKVLWNLKWCFRFIFLFLTVFPSFSLWLYTHTHTHTNSWHLNLAHVFISFAKIAKTFGKPKWVTKNMDKWCTLCWIWPVDRIFFLE